MKRVLLLQLDGKMPNLALMRLAKHLRAGREDVYLRRCGNASALLPELWDSFDAVYASAIFDRTQPLCRRLLEIYPDARIGGTGWDERASLLQLGVTSEVPDYRDYPGFTASMGYTSRGCNFRCSFCKVPGMEGRTYPVATVRELYRGYPWPRHLLLLDNDFFGNPAWRERVQEIREGNFKVCFTQGINARTLSEEHAEAVASVRYYDDQFERRMLYTAWDNLKDGQTLMRGIHRLIRAGVRADAIMVYMLIGYDHERKIGRSFLTPDDFERHSELRALGCRPYPMPYVRSLELVGFQRWCVRRADLMVSWDSWAKNNYRPESLLASTGVAV